MLDYSAWNAIHKFLKYAEDNLTPQEIEKLTDIFRMYEEKYYVSDKELVDG